MFDYTKHTKDFNAVYIKEFAITVSVQNAHKLINRYSPDLKLRKAHM